MKKTIFILCCSAAAMLMSSCASIMSGSKADFTIRNDEITIPVTITHDNTTEQNVFLPYKIKMKRGFSATTVKMEAKGYEANQVKVGKKFNGTTLWNFLIGGIPGWLIDAASGAMMKPESKEVVIPLTKSGTTPRPVERVEITEPTERVSRDNAGQSDLERKIIRWYLDSDPQGARVFWRVISSVPDEVKNTNELYLGTTPFEETRSFNILGLTYENSRDVQIEIKLKRKGYIDQTKRFNVRQAIDQQEISAFFDLIKE